MKLLKRSIIFVVITAIVLIIPLAATSEKPVEEKTMRLGSASLGSSGYIQFEAFSYLINEYSDKFKASSISTAGGRENIVLLGEQKIDFGSGGSPELFDAWENNIPIWQVLSWTYWPQVMLVRADSELNRIEDLKGKSVSLIKKGSGAEFVWNIVFEEYGILDEIKPNYLAWSDSYDALVDGTIVAMPGNYPGGKQHPGMEQMAHQIDYKTLEFDPDIIKRVNKRNPGIIIATLPKTAYKGFKEDMTAPALGGIVISAAHVEDEMVYEFCKAVYEHIDELHELSAVSGATTRESATKWLMPEVPVHPGAARYLKEIGVWNENFKIGKR